MSVNGKFDGITRDDLLAFARQNNIKDASSMIDGIYEKASHWPELAEECSVPQEMTSHIASNMRMDL